MPLAGKYQFYVYADDAVYLEINSEMVIDHFITKDKGWHGLLYGDMVETDELSLLPN